MRFSSLIQRLVVPLVSLTALSTVYAVPIDSNSLSRRADPRTVKIDGKVVELGDLISPETHEKSAVYRVAKYDGHANPGYVLKIYNTGKLNDREIEGLTAVKQYISSDKASHSVVMKEVKGTPMSKVIADTPHDQRKEQVEKFKDLVAKEAADIAKNQKVLHSDLNMNNVFVDGNKIRFIDWEHFIKEGETGFTTDPKTIKDKDLYLWDSTGTPLEYKKPGSKSPKSSPKPGSEPSEDPADAPKPGSKSPKNPPKSEPVEPEPMGAPKLGSPKMGGGFPKKF